MAVQTVYAGTVVTSTATFTNPGSTTPVDPTTISLKISGGGATTVTWVYGGAGSITKVAVGIYSAELDTTVGVLGNPGPWTVEWIGTGTCAVVDIASWTVLKQPI